MFTIPGHKGNVNQNHFTSLLLEWLRSRTQTTANVGKDEGKKETLIQCWWECKLVQSLWKTLWKILKTLKIELLYDLAILLLGICLKQCEAGYNKGTCTHNS
jgi:hypothetical protein